jgi:hypothetical protein
MTTRITDSPAPTGTCACSHVLGPLPRVPTYAESPQRPPGELCRSERDRGSDHERRTNFRGHWRFPCFAAPAEGSNLRPARLAPEPDNGPDRHFTPRPAVSPFPCSGIPAGDSDLRSANPSLAGGRKKYTRRHRHLASTGASARSQPKRPLAPHARQRGRIQHAGGSATPQQPTPHRPPTGRRRRGIPGRPSPPDLTFNPAPIQQWYREPGMTTGDETSAHPARIQQRFAWQPDTARQRRDILIRKVDINRWW